MTTRAEQDQVADPGGAGPAPRGQMGALELAFFVVAAAGPLLVVAGFAPLAFLLGGIGAPGAQLVAALVLLLFAIGFTRMSPRVPNRGAFYAYIGRSLGRPMGGGSATLALAAYSAIAIGQFGAFGAFASGTLSRQADIEVDWVWLSLAALLVVTLLAYRRISLSAKVLGTLLLAEVVILLVLAVPVVLTGGDSGFSFESFNPSHVFTGEGTGAMFVIVFGAFIGFESTAIYSDEARDPRRTVPRATFLAIGFLGLFYTFMAWIAVVAFGSANVVQVATEDPTGMFFVATERYVGHSATIVMEVLLITSTFASSLAFHNTASRYFFTLGTERLLPRGISRINRYGSVGVACLVQAALALATVVVFRLVGADPYLALFLLLAGPGILAVVVLQLLCSVAVTVFFVRERADDVGVFAKYVAPPASAVGLAVATYLIVTNFDLLTGRTDWVNDLLLLTLPAAFLIGLVSTLVVRSRWPDRYEKLTNARVW